LHSYPVPSVAQSASLEQAEPSGTWQVPRVEQLNPLPQAAHWAAPVPHWVSVSLA
jgi:hypothetical protein